MARGSAAAPSDADPGQSKRPTGADGSNSKARRRLSWHQLRAGLTTSAFVVPSLALIVVFFILPFVFNAGFAFSDWTSFSDAIAFNGLDNFRLIIDLGILGHAIEVTVIYAVVVVVFQNVVSLGLATLLQAPSRGTTFFRTMFFLPVLISPLAAGYIWSAMLRPNGPVNSAVSALVPGQFDYGWLGNATSALICTAAIEAWKWSGLATLVYIAGLNSVPRHILEAATVDGATGWTRFWRIKVPLLIPAFTFNLVIGFVGTLSAFDVIMATTSGGPGNATTVLNVALFQQYGVGFFGNASALSLVVTTLVVATAVPLVTFMRRREVAL
jgi:multiple sugar transport system permease protein/raffinose/stachyose/melibiose transport system permease protein